jgi:hypothetical protein
VVTGGLSAAQRFRPLVKRRAGFVYETLFFGYCYLLRHFVYSLFWLDGEFCCFDFNVNTFVKSMVNIADLIDIILFI